LINTHSQRREQQSAKDVNSALKLQTITSFTHHHNDIGIWQWDKNVNFLIRFWRKRGL